MSFQGDSYLGLVVVSDLYVVDSQNKGPAKKQRRAVSDDETESRYGRCSLIMNNYPLIVAHLVQQNGLYCQSMQ
jgi:hypothetical protein